MLKRLLIKGIAALMAIVAVTGCQSIAGKPAHDASEGCGFIPYDNELLGFGVHWYTDKKEAMRNCAASPSSSVEDGSTIPSTGGEDASQGEAE